MKDRPGELRALFQRNDDPKNEVGYHARQPTWQGQKEECQPEPEGIQPKELAQSSADSSKPAATARTSQLLLHRRSVPPLSVIRCPLRTTAPKVAAGERLLPAQGPGRVEPSQNRTRDRVSPRLRCRPGARRQRTGKRGSILSLEHQPVGCPPALFTVRCPNLPPGIAVLVYRPIDHF